MAPAHLFRAMSPIIFWGPQSPDPQYDDITKRDPLHTLAPQCPCDRQSPFQSNQVNSRCYKTGFHTYKSVWINTQTCEIQLLLSLSLYAFLALKIVTDPHVYYWHVLRKLWNEVLVSLWYVPFWILYEWAFRFRIPINPSSLCNAMFD